MTIVKTPTYFSIGLSHPGRYGTKEYKTQVPVMHFRTEKFALKYKKYAT
jgi:hypothetical protein